MTSNIDPNDFIDGVLKALRGDPCPWRDSAWLFVASDTGITSADLPSPEMTAFIQYHQERLAGLLQRATLFVCWEEGDTEASVKILPVDTISEEEANRPFEVIKLPFPPPFFQVRPH
jgi:hypothetical protein